LNEYLKNLRHKGKTFKRYVCGDVYEVYGDVDY